MNREFCIVLLVPSISVTLVACIPTASGGGNYIVNYGMEAHVTKQEACKLAKSFATKDNRGHWVREKCYIIDGRYFFPREVSKLNYVKDWGYSVDPETGAVTFRDFRPRKFKITE